MNFKRCIIIGLLFFLLMGCQSIERYNAHLEQEISVQKLKKDVAFIQKKIRKNHVKYDWYNSKEIIDYRFDSLRQSIQQPLKPNEFYLKVQPIIHSLGHGHTDIYPLFRKYSKEELARTKDSKGIFSQLATFWQNDTLYYSGPFYKKYNLKPGAIILQIDSIQPKQLVDKYQHTFYGDGFNLTYFKNRLNRNFFSYFYTLDYGSKDSILYTFQQDGKVFQQKFYRVFPEKKEEPKKVEKDTVKVVVQKPKAPEEKLKQHEFSFNKSSNSYTRSLSFPTNDSTLAVLKVSTFSHDTFEKDYEEIFKLIQSYKVQNLVLDLRNNGGGRLADSYQLFSYVVPNQSRFLGEQYITSSSAFQRAIVDVFPRGLQPIAYPFSFLGHLITGRNSEGEKVIKPALSRIKNNNPENVYTGNLYVMINGGSYSASALLSSNLKGLQRAFFVGEETGGDANGSVAGLMPDYQLPHSKLKLQLGTVVLSPAHYKTDVVGHGVYPDQVIQPTLWDKIHKKDPELEWIINDIKNDNVALKAVVK